MNSLRVINDKKYLDEIVKLHKNEFSNVLSGQIGKLFLKNYYKRIIKVGILFGYFKKNEIAGFVAGIDNEKKIYNLKYYFFAGIGILFHLHNKKLYLNIRRHLKKIKLYSDVTIQSELLSIVVRNEYRGQGIGKELINTLNTHFQGNNIKKYKVYTDMKYSTGYLLYEKMKFNMFRETDLYGLKFRMYVKNVS